MFSFESLILEQVIFEVRFDHGYLYLDKTGEVLSRLSEKWPTMVVRPASPEGTTIRLEEEGIIASFSAQRLGVHQNYPQKLNVYKNFSANLFNLVCDLYQLTIFARVGNRYQYILPLDDFTEINDFFTRRGLLNLQDKVQQLKGTILHSGLNFRIKRDDLMLTIRMEPFQRDVQLPILPGPITADMGKFVKQGFSVDIDCYSDKLVERGILKADDFITTQERNTKRAIETLLA